jgi:hypothetical protein
MPQAKFQLPYKPIKINLIGRDSFFCAETGFADADAANTS